MSNKGPIDTGLNASESDAVREVLAELQERAEEARSSLAWEEAIDLYTQALDQEGLLPEVAFDLLDERAECRRKLGHLPAEDTDLEAMAGLAREMDDVARQVGVLVRQEWVRIQQGRLAEAREVAEAALGLAREAGDLPVPARRKLEAGSLVALGDACGRAGAVDLGRGYAQAALDLYKDLGDPAGEADSLAMLGYAALRSGNREQCQVYNAAALALYRGLGDREGEGRALNGLGVGARDHAQQRAYYEGALAAWQAAGNRERQSLAYNNLSLLYHKLGLYGRARDHAQRAVDVAREMGARFGLAYHLDGLGRAYLGLGSREKARQLFEEGRDLAREVGDSWAEAAYWMGLGWVALDGGQPAQARDLFHRAADLNEGAGDRDCQASALAWQGAAHLALGRLQAARTCTTQALDLLEAAGEAAGEYPRQEVWWWRYQALRAAASAAPDQAAGTERGEDAWHALDRGREAMLDSIASLSDDGLRRNYFNKVAINRQIVHEWLREAEGRGLPLAPLTAHVSSEGDLPGQLQRMLEIGVRLNARRETGDLPRFIMDEVIELTGAERAALFLLDEKGQRQLAAESAVQTSEVFWRLPKSIALLLDEAAQKRTTLLRYMPASAPELEQRSTLSAALVSGGRLVGLVYADLRGIYGRFSEQDRDLLSVLSNQAAVALENAAWTETLEQRVDERTAELQAANQDLEQRNAEMAVINSIQQGLAQQLDFQAIIDLVGDKIRDIFQADSTSICLYDRQVGMLRFPYSVEADFRAESPPMPLGEGLTSRVIESQQPLVTCTMQEAFDLGAVWGSLTGAPDERHTESYLGVPLLAGGEVLGVVDVQSYEQHAYDEGDVRLLSTIAASLGVALENARLFEETNRLLDETRQRASELAIINDVGQALARQLDVQAIAELVGDKACELLVGDASAVALYDRQTGLLHFPYHAEAGQRVALEPYPLGPGLTSRIVESGQPLIFGTCEEAVEQGAVLVPLDPDVVDEKPTQSYLGVPMVAGGEVTGVVTVHSYRRHAFDQADARLLSTIAANAAVALENARLFAETSRLLAESEQRAAELATVNRVGQALASELDLDSLIQLVGEQVRHTFRADIAYVALLDRQTELIHFPYLFGEELTPLRLGQGLTSQIIHRGEPLLIDQDPDDSDSGPDVQRVGVPARSYLGVPIHVGREVIGVISVQSTQEQGRFDEDDVRLLNTIAANVGTAIHNAQLYQEAQRRAGEMAALAEVGRDVAATLDLPTVLERIAGHARALLIAASSGIYLLQPGGRTLRVIAAVGEVAQALLGMEMEVGRGIVGSIVQRGIAERIDDTTRDTRAVHIPGSDADEEGEKLMVVPLLVQERVIGAMAVWRGPRDEVFGEDDLQFLVGLGQQAAVAIENARLFAEVETQRRYSESIVQTSPVAIVTTDRSGRLLSWNPAAEELFGYPAAEVLGQVLDPLITTPEMRDEARRSTQETAAGAGIHVVTQRCRQDGSLVDVEILTVPLDDGSQQTLIAIYHDISERKQAERELREAKEAAEAATQAKSAFLATMSHEIRTPMNAVIGMTSLLLDTELTAEQQEFAETIRNSGDALLAVINDILDFSKIEAGRIDLERQPFDLRECVEGAVGLMAPRAAEKGLELGCLVDPQLPAAILGDEARLRQILLNLLSNATKFTEAGEVVVTVGTEKPGMAEKAGSWELHFAVRDTGIGIPAEAMGRLFQSFSQVDSSTTRRYGGTGLGLAISKRLTELMGGRMWAESPPSRGGSGSVFHFTMPAEEAAMPARAYLQAAQADLRGKRVLVVDDNATSRRILSLQTRAWGMEARATGSPDEALAWLRGGEAFDVAIVDRQMPEMDGLMLAAEIRKLRRDGGLLPLVMISSLGRGEAGVEGEAFAAFLLKPIRASQLYDALVGILAPEQTSEVLKTAGVSREFDPEMGKRLPLRILLAEDNPVNQKLALRLLQRLGYRADVAGNGLEAIEALRRQQYDVVLMDVQMPEMDGLEATRAIHREWPAAQRPRIIALTANVMKEDQEACFAAGMDDYLGKPIRVEELMAALSRSQAIQDR